MLDALDNYRTSSNKRSCIHAYERPLGARQELWQSAWPIKAVVVPHWHVKP